MKLKIIFSLSLLVIILFNTWTIFAEENKANISVRAEVDKAFITIGERINYRVSIKHKPTIKVLSPLSSTLLSDFEIKDIKDIEPYEENGQIIEGRNFLLTTYALGEYVIDQMEISYLDEKGEEQKIATEKLYITVESVVKSGEEKTDIRGIRGVVDLKRSYVWVVVLFLIFLITAGIYYLRKRIKEKELPRPQILLPPHVEALQALNRLFDSNLLSTGKIKEYYIELSDIIRHYLSRRFEIFALEFTSFEICMALKEKDLVENIRKLIERFLWDCDLVKFAKYRPAYQEIQEINKLAKEIIEKTKEEEKIAEMVKEPLGA